MLVTTVCPNRVIAKTTARGERSWPTLMEDAGHAAALERGPRASLATYRRAYAAAGVAWPGDDQVRRLHPITDEEGSGNE